MIIDVTWHRWNSPWHPRPVAPPKIFQIGKPPRPPEFELISRTSYLVRKHRKYRSMPTRILLRGEAWQ